jgi:hypothetical protein
MTRELRRRVVKSDVQGRCTDFADVTVSSEVRACPSSGHVTRVLTFRPKTQRKEDYAALVDKSLGLACRFCPDAVESNAARVPSAKTAGFMEVVFAGIAIFDPSVEGLRNMVSVVGSAAYPPMDISDVNYFDKMHAETITFEGP